MLWVPAFQFGLLQIHFSIFEYNSTYNFWHRCRSRQIYGGAKEFCPDSPKLAQKILQNKWRPKQKAEFGRHVIKKKILCQSGRHFCSDIQGVKLYAHGMRPVRFLSACLWFRDVKSFSDAFGKVCVRRSSRSESEQWVWCVNIETSSTRTQNIPDASQKGRDVTKSDACVQKSHRTHVVCIQF